MNSNVSDYLSLNTCLSWQLKDGLKPFASEKERKITLDENYPAYSMMIKIDEILLNQRYAFVYSERDFVRI